MKTNLFLFFLTGWISLHAQEPACFKDECAFFQFLKTSRESNYQNAEYLQIKNDVYHKALLLQKLEAYLVVFDDYTIKPMYLSDKDSVFVCEEYSNAFNQYRTEQGYHEARASVQNSKEEDIRLLLYDLTGIAEMNNDAFEMNLAEFNSVLPMEYLIRDIEDVIKVKEKDQNAPVISNTSLLKIPKLTLEQNRDLLINRMDKLNQKKYVFYEHYNSKPNMIKGFEMYHENDVFMVYPCMNQDRELTGGFKFTFVTDYFKWRGLNFGSFFRSKTEQQRLLTYQTISAGGRGYTPYIRYRNNSILADSLHNYDRPFASSLYYERAKYRTWTNGLVRHTGSFQIGTIGISQGRKIQAKLHEDVIYDSQFVHGWDKQIANGGRLVLQLNHKADFMLLSTTNKFFTIFRPKTIQVEEPKKYAGWNLSAEVELNFGTILTAGGVGVRLSSLDFLKQSGVAMIASRPKARFDDFGFKLDIGFSYKYIVHNSMLEGLGLTCPFPLDAYDKVNPDVYVLDDEVYDHMFYLDYGLHFRWRKTTFFLRQTIHTLEYNSGLDNIDFNNLNFISNLSPNDAAFYDHNVIGEQTRFVNRKIGDRTIYGYGTLGVCWVID